ncbi:MAG TPA: DUF2807 domain-containing protein [Flavobacteriales bacterium]|nr:DUF2807 domain-containing protein [Flavobacteriales bacterium]
MMRTKNLILYIVILCISAGLAACSKSKNDCFKANGDLVQEIRNLPDFIYIEIYNDVNVVLTQSSETYVEIEAGENLMDKIIAEVVNDTLVLRNNNKCNWARNNELEVTAFIGVAGLKKITHVGYGKITSTNKIIADHFYISNQSNGDIILDINNNYTFCAVHGSGDLNLKGNTGGIDIWSSGQHWIRCAELITTYTAIYTKTTGDCYIYGADSVKIILDGYGNVFYAGNPAKVISEKWGGGTISPL